MQFKTLHRLHYSGNKLAKLFNIPDSGCPRCGQTPASLGHMFWTCPSLNNYWKQIFDVFSQICRKEITPSFHSAIFGILPPDCAATSPQTNALAFASLLARRLILLNWKSAKSPSFQQWLKDVMSFLPLEKLRYKVDRAQKNFVLTWSPFVDFVERHWRRFTILSTLIGGELRFAMHVGLQKFEYRGKSHKEKRQYLPDDKVSTSIINVGNTAEGLCTTIITHIKKIHWYAK